MEYKTTYLRWDINNRASCFIQNHFSGNDLRYIDDSFYIDRN